jgi:hypothetical protein
MLNMNFSITHDTHFYCLILPETLYIAMDNLSFLVHGTKKTIKITVLDTIQDIYILFLDFFL